MHEFHRLCLLKKKKNKSGLGGEQAMVESVELQKLSYLCNKKEIWKDL